MVTEVEPHIDPTETFTWIPQPSAHWKREEERNQTKIESSKYIQPLALPFAALIRNQNRHTSHPCQESQHILAPSIPEEPLTMKREKNKSEERSFQNENQQSNLTRIAKLLSSQVSEVRPKLICPANFPLPAESSKPEKRKQIYNDNHNPNLLLLNSNQ